LEPQTPAHHRQPRRIEREERLNQLINTAEERLNRLGAELRAAQTELTKRDLSTLSTGRLLSHIESLRRQVRREAGQSNSSPPWTPYPR